MVVSTVLFLRTKKQLWLSAPKYKLIPWKERKNGERKEEGAVLDAY
jgi:hypothetical protein